MVPTGRFYIDGAWVAPLGQATAPVIDPATGAVIADLAMGSPADVDRAVAAARAAFPGFAAWPVRARQDLLRSVLKGIEARLDELAAAMTAEMGAPTIFARESQAQSGADHFAEMIRVMDSFAFEERQGGTLILREPIGVCGLITPWNWPLNQIACKVAPALAAGCTMVLKPSELAPLNALILAEILHAAGVPPGVFNLVNGDGPTVGAAMSAHPGIDMMSFTGSTRAGIAVARAAADTVKRVAQELGGNSANIVFGDGDFAASVRAGVLACMSNSGQSCNSPARMLVPRDRMDEAATAAQAAVRGLRVGAPSDPATDLGPVVSAAQWRKIQGLIEAGIAEGGRLVTGGLGMPEGLERGWFVRPTVFADVRPEMTIARSEIFGPVISLIGFADEDEAVSIANGTEYGLAAYVQSADRARARRVARRMRAGWVEVNHAPFDYAAPFGGYKQSGNGREYGAFGLAEFLEVKAVMGL